MTESKLSIKKILLNPFKYWAGPTALVAGLIILIITSLLADITNTHFDGILDAHFGPEAPFYIFIAENLINWLTLSIALTAAALILAKSKWRMIDLFGTQALARWPYIIAAVVTIPTFFRSSINELNRFTIKMAEYADKVKANDPNAAMPGIPAADIGIILAFSIIMMVVVVWMIYLMYRSYSVSCNLKGPKAIISFIAALIAAEIVSKVAILAIMKQLQP